MYANQKRIIINKVESNASNKYTINNITALRNAMCDLTKIGATKLYIYLAHNQHKFELNLSFEACKKWGLKKDSYHNAVKELIDKGYLVQIKGNYYNFFESP